MQEKIIKVVNEYLISIGVNKTIVNDKLKNCKEILSLVLPEVCTLKINRPGSASKQYHIHITGEAMAFFFDEDDLKNNPKELAKDEQQEIILFKKNLENLSACAKQDRGFERNISSSTNTEIIQTYTFKKVGHNGSQVQISKTRLDDEEFMNLRRCLFTNDVLVFIKLQDDTVLALGIPNSYYLQTKLANNNVYKKINETVEERGDEHNLRKVSYNNIATFNPTDEDDDKIFNLSDGIYTRKKRTERHQDIVKLLAIDLERAGYLLYENPVDCLAIKDNSDSLLFEIKTLDGSPSDERKQVQKAFSQLYYYEHFSIKEIANNTIKKVVVFEKRINKEHIIFFETNGINVFWLNETKHFENIKGTIEMGKIS